MKGVSELKSAVASQPQLVSVAIIAMISFLLFNVLFQQVTPNEYFKEIVAALIATLLTVVITTLLLKAQTTGQETRERNVAVFRRKVESYDRFLDTAVEALADDSFSDGEIKDIRKQIFQLSLFSSSATVDTVLDFVRGRILNEIETAPTIGDLVAAFRTDLRLENVAALTTVELDDLSSLMASRFEHRQLYAEVAHSFNAMFNELTNALSETLTVTSENEPSRRLVVNAPEARSSRVQGHLNLTSLYIDSDHHFISIGVDYPRSSTFSQLTANVYVNLTAIRADDRTKVEAAFLKKAYTWDASLYDESGEEGRHLSSVMEKNYNIRSKTGSQGGAWTSAQKRIVSDLTHVLDTIA